MTYKSKSPVALLVTFVVLFGIHLIGSFMAWSVAPGNVVPHAGQAYTLAQRSPGQSSLSVLRLTVACVHNII